MATSSDGTAAAYSGSPPPTHLDHELTESACIARIGEAGDAQLPTSLLLIALLGGLRSTVPRRVPRARDLARLLTFVAIYRDLYVAPPLM